MHLTKEQHDFWKAHSYLKISGLFREESKDISSWVEEIGGWPENREKWLHFFEMDNPEKLSRIENFAPFHQRLERILCGEHTTQIVSELMGEPAILYKDRINFKYPEGGAHSAHQDGVAYESLNQPSFSNATAQFISILVSVDPATKENGCLEFAADWPFDKTDILEMERPDPKHPNFSKIAQSTEDALHWVPIETEPGDAILFTERLPHRSDKNRSQHSRRILYGVYNPAAAGDLRAAYYAKKRVNMNDPRYMVGNPHAPSAG